MRIRLRRLPVFGWRFAQSGAPKWTKSIASSSPSSGRTRRTPLATLAKKLRVARGTVQNRLAKLEADGTVMGYTVRLRPQVEEQRIRALMSVAVEGNKAEAVLRALRGDPAVGALYSTNGRWDLVAELRADSLEAFDRVLGRIRLIEGISSTETSLLLSTHKL